LLFDKEEPMPARFSAREWVVGNWFLVLLPALFAISFFFTRSVDWGGTGGMAEAVTLFDWCVSIPFLYFLCYRKKLPARQLILRLLALACLGIWVATLLVPAAYQEILPQLSWPRRAGLAILVLIELRVLVAALRIVFSGTATAAELSQGIGIPPLIARMMMAEARFWRAVWRLIRGR
jgi:hypothetical protein